MTPCPICGTVFKPHPTNKKTYCSQSCALEAQTGKTQSERERVKTIIARYYPSRGAEVLARRLGLAECTVQDIAYKVGVKLEPNIYKNRVHGAAAQYLTEHNPMKSQEIVEKVKEHYRQHPDKQQRIMTKLLEGHQRIQKSKPTQLEKKLFGILDNLGVRYTSYPLIKPKFIVDVQIDNLIIQADGDYWHGHPRFEPLTDRQKSQRKRDEAQDKYLIACGYSVERIWECEMSQSRVIDILTKHGLYPKTTPD